MQRGGARAVSMGVRSAAAAIAAPALAPELRAEAARAEPVPLRRCCCAAAARADPARPRSPAPAPELRADAARARSPLRLVGRRPGGPAQSADALRMSLSTAAATRWPRVCPSAAAASAPTQSLLSAAAPAFTHACMQRGGARANLRWRCTATEWPQAAWHAAWPQAAWHAPSRSSSWMADARCARDGRGMAARRSAGMATPPSAGVGKPVGARGPSLSVPGEPAVAGRSRALLDPLALPCTRADIAAAMLPSTAPLSAASCSLCTPRASVSAPVATVAPASPSRHGCALRLRAACCALAHHLSALTVQCADCACAGSSAGTHWMAHTCCCRHCSSAQRVVALLRLLHGHCRCHTAMELDTLAACQNPGPRS
jgi:hypothetical protein